MLRRQHIQLEATAKERIELSQTAASIEAFCTQIRPEKPTPERVLQGLGGLFSQIDTPARPPKAGGKSPGWSKGRPQTRHERQRVVKKSKKKSKKKRWAARLRFETRLLTYWLALETIQRIIGYLNARKKENKVTMSKHSMLVTMIICISFLAACGQPFSSVDTPSFTLEPSPTLANPPDFLPSVFPPPGDLIDKREVDWDGSTWALLMLDQVAVPGEVLSLDEITTRVEFLLDGEQLDPKVEECYEAQCVMIDGNIPVDLGEHRATVRVHRSSGEVLEYSWTFTVLDKEPTVPGLPQGLQFVRPLPDSTVTQRAFLEEQLVPPYYAPTFADLRGGVCAGIQLEFVDPHLTLDEPGISKIYSLVSLDGIVPDDSNMVWRFDGVHHYKCWFSALAPGVHEAKVQLGTVLGEATEYTWQFTILDD